MKLSDLQLEWEKDSVIDESILGIEATRVPRLHSKYLNLYTSAKLNLHKAQSDYSFSRRKKFRYYRGELTRAELDEEGWDQWQGSKPLKSEMDEYLQSDVDLLKHQDRVNYLSTVLVQLESILNSIKSRTWDIRNAIECMKFQNGS